MDLQLIGAGIPHLLFHRVRWKFREAHFVSMGPIAPDDHAPLTTDGAHVEPAVAGKR